MNNMCMHIYMHTIQIHGLDGYFTGKCGLVSCPLDY